MDPPRFNPLVGDDFRLTLVNNRIHATGWLEHPPTGTRVAAAVVDHNLRTGAGEAVLDVPGIAFNQGFQPDALTRLTVGVVALVDGTVTGQGRIVWDGGGTRSTGTFSTAGMDLAFPFGPVEGLSTTIQFSDLLGLTSAPGQVARMDLVRAGIDVYDGTLLYQLQPNSHVAIESGRWPYAGGELILQPTVLDFSQPSTKYLTFQVVGLDAARFVQLMEFSNISATGTFDGIVPMQFDQRGGRIVGGRLAAREGGGTLSYIGELTDRDLGIYGKMAFDALKALRYDRFDMTLDGALDGEFVTNIDLDGIARNPPTPIRAPGGGIAGLIAGRALNQLARIPFEFNIRIQGPFRALLATARSFEDPTLLIQPILPRLLRDLPTTVTDVQDEESENQR
jgi:translocation and assembly module TamB